MKMKQTWRHTMMYMIACLKQGDKDGWAEAQLLHLAEVMDANGSEIAVEIPRHAASLEMEALGAELGIEVLYVDDLNDEVAE